MPTWSFRAVLPDGASYSGQLVYPSNDIDLPYPINKYIDNVSILQTGQFVTKYTGFESQKYKIKESSGSDIETLINIQFVGDMPFEYRQRLLYFTSAMLGSGMIVQFYDDIVTDRQYTGRLVDAFDISLNNSIHTVASVTLSTWESQALS